MKSVTRKLRKRRRGFFGGGGGDVELVDVDVAPGFGSSPAMGVVVAGGEAWALGGVRVVCAGLFVIVA
jgi:hypothetical protein